MNHCGMVVWGLVLEAEGNTLPVLMMSPLLESAEICEFVTMWLMSLKEKVLPVALWIL